MIKLWIDDIRPAPKDYDYWITSVVIAKDMIEANKKYVIVKDENRELHIVKNRYWNSK